MEDSSWLHAQNIVFEVNESYKLHANILYTLFVLIGSRSVGIQLGPIYIYIYIYFTL
jgi:hypothetical protein